MRDDRPAQHIIGLTTPQADAGRINFDLGRTLGIRLHVVHVARVVSITRRAAVLCILGVEVFAGAAGVGCAAIAFLMDVESKFTIRR